MLSSRAFVAALRPHQWTKNLLIFAPLALSKHLFEADALLRSLGAFAIFCGLSGTVYLINDLTDLERDRLHPKKRLRPLASGALSREAALGAAVLLGLACVGSALTLGPAFLAAAVGYVALNLAYSFWLKGVVILDVIAISLGFVLRAVAGAVAISVQFSDWLLVCTLLLALFLALAKRRHELVSMTDEAAEHREILAEYSPYPSTR
jgi:4-hydroxybenzoate polyprenyltransferase